MRKHRVLLCSCLEYLAFYLCRYNLPPVLPVLIAHFNVTHGEIGTLASMGFVSYAIILLPAGFLGDAFGSQKVVTLGAIVSVISNILFSYASSFPTALAFQFLNGLGQGMAWGPLTRLISDRYPKENIELVMSILLVPPNIGPTLAYTVSSYLATNYDWRAAFLYPPAALLVLTGLFWLLIKNQPSHLSGKEDEHISIKERFSLVLSNRNLWFIALAYSCYMYISRCLLIWLPTYLVEETHLSPFSASILGGLATLSGIGPMFIGARLANMKTKGRNNLIIALSFALTIPVIWMLPRIADATQILTLFSMVFAFLNLGGSLYFSYSPVFLSKEVVGTASGFIDSLAYVGSFLGIILTGLIFDAYLSYDPVFILLTIIAGAGMIISSLIKKAAI